MNIEEEIRKNGNTNFITNSDLETGQQIFAIGDSHTIFFYNSMKIKEHWFYNNNTLPLTIYNLINNGLDILNIGNILGNGHELYNIKENDFVIMYFGYNDIQKNIYLHAKNRWKEEIEYLIHKYIEYILNVITKYKVIPIISCIYPNPISGAQTNSMGPIEERINYTIYANELLKSLCIKENINYLDIYDFITDENGLIKNIYTKDKIHIDYDNKFLRDYIDNKIIDYIKSI